jgi:hypothetical protein
VNSGIRGIMKLKDFRLVDMSRSFEVAYWAADPGVSRPKLTALVGKAGNSVQAVRRKNASAAE